MTCFLNLKVQKSLLFYNKLKFFEKFSQIEDKIDFSVQATALNPFNGATLSTAPGPC